ncbi:MAG TPA: glycosyltransferase, partial [Acidobacteriaceae bacterium]|nr:glycosyltransferase [Acidobacteriaceae bacterium]
MFATVIAAITTLLTIAGFGFYILAIWSARAFLRRRRFPAGFAPGVSILKPLRGVDPGMYEAFASHCRQQYAGEYEMLFGVSSLDDPAVELVRRLEQEFPERSIRLLLCTEVLGPNGKVSNLAQLVPQARYDYLLINDSDIRVGPQYLTRVMAAFVDAPRLPNEGRAGAPGSEAPGDRPVGLVTALYRG